MIYSLLATVGEIETAIFNPTAHYKAQRKTVFSQSLTGKNKPILFYRTHNLSLLLH